MALRITIEAESRRGLVAVLADWIGVLTGEEARAEAPPAALTQQIPLPITDAVPEPAEATARKRGRPRKEDTVPPATSATPATPVLQAPVDPMAALTGLSAPSSPPAAVPTYQQVIDALMAVAAVRPGDSAPTTGYERVSKILQAHKLTNVKDIKEEHRAAILAACVGA